MIEPAKKHACTNLPRCLKMDERQGGTTANVSSGPEAPKSPHRDKNSSEKATASGNASEQGDSEPATSVAERRGRRAKSGSIAKRIACKCSFVPNMLDWFKIPQISLEKLVTQFCLKIQWKTKL